MIDDDIHRLDERDLGHSLSQLESDIWRRVAARAQRRDAARVITSFQSVILIFSLLGSAAAGLSAVQATGALADVTPLTSGIELMPSSLLLGQPP